MNRISKLTLASLIIFFLLFDGSLTFRPYAVIGGISISLIIGIVGLIYCLLMRRFPWSELTHPISILVTTLTIYLFFSNYSYYHTFDFTVLNNPMFFLLILWTITVGNQKELAYSAISIVIAIICLLGVGFYSIYTSGVGARALFFGNPRQVAFFVLLVFPFLLLLADARHRGKRILLIIIQILCVIYVILSGGRLNTIILIVMFALLGYLKVGRQLADRRFYLLLPLGFICVAALTSLISGFFLHFQFEEIGEMLGADILSPQWQAVTQGRTILYESAFKAFADYPLFGIGYDSWNDIGNVYNPYRAFREVGISVHSFHLQMLAETGLVGFCLYEILLAYMLIKGWNWMNVYSIYTYDIRWRIGSLVFLTAFLFFTGGTLDNHGLQYRHIFFAAALMALYESKLGKANV